MEQKDQHIVCLYCRAHPHQISAATHRMADAEAKRDGRERCQPLDCRTQEVGQHPQTD